MAQPKPGFGEIAPQQLMRLIGTPDAPFIIDVCLPEDTADAPFRIPTSLPASHKDLDQIVALCTRQRVVIVCQKGKKLSHGVAARLRARGIATEVLSGGMHAWCASPNLPRIPIAHLPQSRLWVTRHRPKIDRIACPWLIRRFVDRGAEVLYVPPAEVEAVADRFGAIPFDIPGVAFSHRDGGCTFDTLLDHYGLRTDALLRLAAIVRAADTDTLDNQPQAAGLFALSVGLSRMYRDDQAQLAAGLPLYDALYRWARDGQEETHDWDTESGQ